MVNGKLENIITNFSKLSNVNCVLFIQNFLPEALESENYFEWELVAKLMTLPETDREALTKALNDAIKRNQQKIAGASVADWLKKYLDKYNGIERTPNTFFEFCSRTPEIQKLAKQDQIRLMRVFRMYDYLLVEPIFDLEYPVGNILRFPMRLDSTPAEISGQVQTAQAEFRPAQRIIAEKLPLRDLLKKYPATGEQMVTGGQLKLAHFDRPVRPSIRNWLYDYTSQLGQERHDSMTRMKYLFSSENGKNLTSPDREKLGIILKSFDENVPLPVDAGRNEIIFENLEGRGDRLKMEEEKPPVSSIQQTARQQKMPQETFIKPYPKPRTQPQQKFSTPGPQSPASHPSPPSAQSMQFSTPYPKSGTHEPQPEKPAENISNVRFAEGLPKKSVSQQNFPAKPQIKSAIPPKISFSRPRRNIIEPIGRAKPEPKIEGNVVDLSEKNS